MLLLGPTMQSCCIGQLLHLSGGRELWDELEEQFGLGEDCQGPVWQREWRQLEPLPLEGVVAYSRHVEALAVKLGRAGRQCQRLLKIMHGSSCACMSQLVWITVRHEHI
jgi:hypothetical protein